MWLKCKFIYGFKIAHRHMKKLLFCRRSVEGAGELAEVAAEGVAMGIKVGGHGTRMMGGVVGGAAADIHHRGSVGGQGLVGAGGDAAATGEAR